MTAPQLQKQKSLLLKVIAPILTLIVFVILALTWIKMEFTPSGQKTDETAEIQVGKNLPLFSMRPLHKEKDQSISEIPGKIFFLTFWATWCEACMEEMPNLVQMRERYHNQGLEIIGINLDENFEEIGPKVIEKYHLEFPIFKDPDGKLADLFDVHAIPMTVIFDKNRKILYTKSGEQNWLSPEFSRRMDQWLTE